MTFTATDLTNPGTRADFHNRMTVLAALYSTETTTHRVAVAAINDHAPTFDNAAIATRITNTLGELTAA